MNYRVIRGHSNWFDFVYDHYPILGTAWDASELIHTLPHYKLIQNKDLRYFHSWNIGPYAMILVGNETQEYCQELAVEYYKEYKHARKYWNPKDPIQNGDSMLCADIIKSPIYGRYYLFMYF